MQKIKQLIVLMTVVTAVGINSSFAGSNQSYATIGMLNNNGTLCTQYNKHCSLFVSRATMNGAGVRDDGGSSGSNGVETANIICQEEGSLIDGGTHQWLPWLSTSTADARNIPSLAISGVRYYRPGGAVFVLDARSLTTPSSNKLGASLDGTSTLYWSGTTAAGIVAATTCTNWTVTTGTGQVGYRESSSSLWTQQSTPACTTQQPVLCLQQIGTL